MYKLVSLEMLTKAATYDIEIGSVLIQILALIVKCKKQCKFLCEAGHGDHFTFGGNSIRNAAHSVHILTLYFCCKVNLAFT